MEAENSLETGKLRPAGYNLMILESESVQRPGSGDARYVRYKGAGRRRGAERDGAERGGAERDGAERVGVGHDG